MIADWTLRGRFWLAGWSEKLRLGTHDAGGRPQSAVRTVAVPAAAGRVFGAGHFALVEGNQGAFIVVDGARVLSDIAGVVNASRQFTEITLLDGFEGAYADFGGLGDLLERDASIAANRGQTQDAFFLFHLPASPGIHPVIVPTPR